MSSTIGATTTPTAVRTRSASTWSTIYYRYGPATVTNKRYLNALAAWAMPPEYREPDQLQVTFDGANLHETWSPLYSGMVVLQSSDTPVGGTWIDHGSGTGREVVLDAPDASVTERFYRLARPQCGISEEILAQETRNTGKRLGPAGVFPAFLSKIRSSWAGWGLGARR